jgi:hypothetical protein
MARGTRSDNADLTVTIPETDAEVAARKGRATPKRTEARQLRAQERKAAPKNRKEAAAARREAMRTARESLNSTDVSKLPKRERQPELVYTRDLVDSRIWAAQSLVWLMIFTLVIGTFLPVFDFVAIAVIVVIAPVSYFDARGIARKVSERFPDSSVPVRFYAIRRAMAPRRMRKPVPRLKRGAEVR